MSEDDDVAQLVRAILSGHRLTPGADVDVARIGALLEHADALPTNFESLWEGLSALSAHSTYEAAVRCVVPRVREAMDELMDHDAEALCEPGPLPDEVYLELARRFAKHPRHRTRARRLAERLVHDEVALPRQPGGRWDHTGWYRGLERGGLHRHETGTRRQRALGVPVLEDIGQLRALLGVVSEHQLAYLLGANYHLYHVFHVPKRRGGQRRIAAPCAQLCLIQQKILAHILDMIPPHPAAHGYVKGRSTLTNAAPHCHKEVLVKFDLTDFFGAIHYWRVVGLFASMGYATGDLRAHAHDDEVEVAPTLARLCCFQPGTERAWPSTPQGAPSSPAISNLVCRTLDARLLGLAKRLGGDYTRYADDLTFSFDRTPARGLGRLRWWVNQICHQEGFLVREDKFRVIRRSQQQRVTGIVVNDGLSIPREVRRRFRAIVHNCERHGVASQARGRQDFTSYLRGFAAYFAMVHPDQGAELRARVEALLGEEEGS